MNDRAPVSEPAGPPEFVPSEEERLESLATTGRGPLRLAAAAVLAADHRRAARLARRAGRRRTGEVPAATDRARPVAPAPAPAAKATPVGTAKVKAATAPASEPARRPGSRTARVAKGSEPAPRPLPAPAPAPAQPAARRRKDRAVTPAELTRARSRHHAKLLDADPVQKVADERAWERWASTSAALEEDDGLERLDGARLGRRLSRRPKATAAPAPTPAPAAKTPKPAPAKGSWRSRAGALLDRLAEQEVARGVRLEAKLIPLGRSDRP